MVITEDFDLLETEQPALDSVDFEFVSPDGPTGLSATVIDRDTVELEWTDNATGEDGYRVYQRFVGDDWEEIADLPRGSESYTADGLLDGRDYEFYVEVYTGSQTDSSSVAAASTPLPDVDDFDLDASTPGELAVFGIVPQIDNGQYRIRWRRSEEDDWDPEDEGTIDHDAAANEFTFDVLGGEEYDVSVRSETGDKTGDYLDATDLTILSPADDVTISDVETTSLTISWESTVEFVGDYEVWRRRTDYDPAAYDDDRGEIVATVDASVETYDDSSLAPRREYEYTIVARTQYMHANSDPATVTTADAGLERDSIPQSGVHVEIDHPQGTIRPDVLETSSVSPEIRGQPTAQLEVERDPSWMLESYEGLPIRMWIDGDRVPVEEIEDYSVEDDRVSPTAVGGTALENDVQLDVVDERVSEIVELLLEDTDLVANVDEPEADVDEEVAVALADDELSFEELLEALPVDDEHLPIEVDGNTLTPLQTCQVIDLSGGDSDDAYSSGEAAEPNFAESISFDYTVPSEHVEVPYREGIFDNSDDDTSYRLVLGGVELWDELDAGTNTEPNWEIEGIYGSRTDDDFQSGNLVFEYVSSPDSGDGYFVDVAAVWDARYHSSDDLDNEVHEPGGALDGPPLYPSEPIVLETETLSQFREAIAGYLDVETGHDGTVDSLELSADDGQTWIDAEDTTSLEGGFPEQGPHIRGRIGLGNYTPEPRDETPRKGYKPQTVEVVDIRADFDDRPIVLNRLLEGDLGDVLDELAEVADAVWEVSVEDGELTLEWTWPGDRQASTPARSAMNLSVSKESPPILKARIRGGRTSSRETVDADPGEWVDLRAKNIIPGTEVVEDEDGEEYERGLDYKMENGNGQLRTTETGAIDASETVSVEYDYKISGEYEHDEYDGDPRTRLTETMSDLSTERACEQAAMYLVRELSTPRYEVSADFPHGELDSLVEAVELEDLDIEVDDRYLLPYEKSIDADRVSATFGTRRSSAELFDGIEGRLSAANDRV